MPDREWAESLARVELAHELHDDVIQKLVAAAWRLEVLASQLDEQPAKSVRGAMALLTDVQLRLRSLMIRLDPPQLEAEDVVPAFEDLAGDLLAGTPTTIVVTGATPTGVSAEPAGLAYRIIAYVLQSIRSETAASNVWIEIDGRPGSAMLAVDVRHESATAAGELLSASEFDVPRALAVSRGGTFEVESEAGGHTTIVRYALPLRC